MTTTTQRIIPHRRRPQIFLDRDHTYAAIEAALAKHDNLTFWLKRITSALIRAIRKIRRAPS
jgi:hypothetical protein